MRTLPEKKREESLQRQLDVKLKIFNALNDSLDVVHKSVLGLSYNGRTIKKTQLNAALAVIRMAQHVDLSGAQQGLTVNITNVPRPERSLTVVESGGPDEE